MPRKRLAMELISNKRARLSSFEKRKKGLKKAAFELSTLCGVDIAMIIVCNDVDSDVWPPNRDSVARMTKVHNSGLTQCRSYGVRDYLEEKREKAEKEMKKMREKARDCKYALLETMSRDQLRELSSFLRAKIGAVRERIKKSRVFALEIEQQQVLAYHNSYANVGYYEEENNMGYNFDGVQNNNAYFSYENCCQTEVMGMNEVEPLMCYDMPNEEMRMLQNWLNVNG